MARTGSRTHHSTAGPASQTPYSPENPTQTKFSPFSPPARDFPVRVLVQNFHACCAGHLAPIRSADAPGGRALCRVRWLARLEPRTTTSHVHRPCAPICRRRPNRARATKHNAQRPAKTPPPTPGTSPGPPDVTRNGGGWTACTNQISRGGVLPARRTHDEVCESTPRGPTHSHEFQRGKHAARITPEVRGGGRPPVTVRRSTSPVPRSRAGGTEVTDRAIDVFGGWRRSLKPCHRGLRPARPR